jgi:hypothetical protein
MSQCGRSSWNKTRGSVFQFIWIRGFRGEDQNVKSKRTMDAKWWQKLTLPLVRWAKKTNETVDKSVHSLSISVTINKAKTFLDSREIFRRSADPTFYVNYRPITIKLLLHFFKCMSTLVTTFANTIESSFQIVYCNHL